MPIEKGQEWGSPGALADDAPHASSDAEFAQLLTDGATQVRPTGGDLARTLGVSEASLRRDAAMLLPIDAFWVSLDGHEHRCIAHAVIGRPSRPRVVVANAAFLGAWNVAPRAHPGDGKLDVVRFDLGLVDWIKARKRLPTGAHVPHPGIKTRAVAEWTETFERPVPVQLDGVTGHRARTVSVRIDSEAVIAGV